MIVGERLRAVREAKKMSQGDIEERTGLFRCYVSRVENGHTIPSLDTLEKWTKALDINLSQLFSENDEPAQPIAALKNGQIKLNHTQVNGLRRIQSAFAKMDSRDIAIVVGLAKKLAGAK